MLSAVEGQGLALLSRPGPRPHIRPCLLRAVEHRQRLLSNLHPGLLSMNKRRLRYRRASYPPYPRELELQVASILMITCRGPILIKFHFRRIVRLGAAK